MMTNINTISIQYLPSKQFHFKRVCLIFYYLYFFAYTSIKKLYILHWLRYYHIARLHFFKLQRILLFHTHTHKHIHTSSQLTISVYFLIFLNPNICDLYRVYMYVYINTYNNKIIYYVFYFIYLYTAKK